MGSAEPDPNSLWKIKFDKEFIELASTYYVNLQHIKSNKFLGIYYGYDYGNYSNRRNYYKSLLTEHTEGNKLNNIL